MTFRTSWDISLPAVIYTALKRHALVLEEITQRQTMICLFGTAVSDLLGLAGCFLTAFLTGPKLVRWE